MSRTVREVSLPNNPKWVSVDVSDGGGSFPKNTEPIPESDGSFNYYKPVDLNHGLANKWRISIGQALAEMLGLPEKESKSWVLKDWPAGYHFFDHHKGYEHNMRHDLYLIGSKLVNRFRSPNEFIPHAYWLIKDQGRNEEQCQCKYCNKLPQREISQAMGLSQRASSSANTVARFSQLPQIDRVRKRKLRAMTGGNLSAFTRKVPKVVKLPIGPTQCSLPERENDLWAFLAPKALGEKRWAREGELIWVRLGAPINLGRDERMDVSIRYWPGLVEAIHFRSNVLRKQSSDVNMDDDSTVSFSEERWEIIHESVYKIRLVVSSKTVSVGADSIVPYQAQAPADALMKIVQTVLFNVNQHNYEALDPVTKKPTTRNRLREQFQAFDPFPNTPFVGASIRELLSYNERAAGSYALAIEAASNLASFWTPTDLWEFKMALPDPANDSQKLITEGALPSTFQGLGRRSVAEGSAVQKRFQGLWWGPERIWCGDFVRLRICRQQFVPDGNEVIKRPSGGSNGRSREEDGAPLGDNLGSPSASRSGPDAIETDVDMGNLEEAPGSASRSLFMLVGSLFVITIPKPDGLGTTNGCHASGTLYELADEDWESDDESFPSPTRPPPSSTLFAPNAALLSELPGDERTPPPDRNLSPEIDAAIDGDAGLSSALPDAPNANMQDPLNVLKPDNTDTSPRKHEIPARPVGPTLPLPDPPSRLKFRPILKDDHEVIFPLPQLAGRYYPGILNSPNLHDRVMEAQTDYHSLESKTLWALDGRVSGFYNFIDPVQFLPRRSEMMREAKSAAWDNLVKYWKREWETNKARGNAIRID